MYIVIGYKEHYTDYCRGCYMGSYPADTCLERLETAQEVADYIAKKEAFDPDGRRKEWNWNVITAEMIEDEDTYFGNDLTYDTMPNDVAELVGDARKREYAKADEREKQREAEKEAKRKAEQKARDQREFERLKEKLGQ